MTDRKKLAVAHPALCGNEKKYVLECLETGWISSIGRFISLFEEQFAAYCGSEYAVACSSGTCALHLALAALGVGPGDEVIVPTLTYIASANAVTYCGARPVFVDSEDGTMNIDPNLIARHITPRTKAIVAVHLYGHPADMDAILKIAREHGLAVVEDAAESHGALYKGRRTGSLADIAAFSFYGNKIVTTGEGGMVTCSNRALENKLRMLRGQGMDPGQRYWFPMVGYNYRMTNVAAAIGVAQLEQIDKLLERRFDVASEYRKQLTPYEDLIQLPVEESWARHAFWAYTVVLREPVNLGRDEIMRRLADDGIETRPVFYPMHVMPPYAEDRAVEYPVANWLSQRGIMLPMHTLLDDEDVAYIASRLVYWCKARLSTAMAR
ncbi:MAG TPA: DegT/DnrJ/EryC1/StrS family aminotransferase [Bryobacteraceae bacterium]|jgi:perosamine synthetase|nr:DegT/DnrJ/EryC1/StrS family aminotransferase [Bryobacteraceae bacterium]